MSSDQNSRPEWHLFDSVAHQSIGGLTLEQARARLETVPAASHETWFAWRPGFADWTQVAKCEELRPKESRAPILPPPPPVAIAAAQAARKAEASAKQQQQQQQAQEQQPLQQPQSQPQPQKQKPASERRKHVRHPLKLRVTLVYGGKSFRSFTKDISEGGFLLAQSVPWALPNESCEVFIENALTRARIRFRARIITQADDPARISFHDADPQAIKTLEQWMKQTLRNLATKIAVGLALLALPVSSSYAEQDSSAPPATAPSAGGPALDRSAKPDFNGSKEPVAGEEIPPIYREMGVIQRKAIGKANKLLFSTYFSMDFSDGPFSMYGVNFSPGYAFSDFFEIYGSVTPIFINNKRSIAEKVEQLTLANGQRATIEQSLPQLQYGIEGIWAPLYGKDSFGMKTIVRSDTFLKLGIYRTQYDPGFGMKYQLGAGKTYFLGTRVGLRVTITGNYFQEIIDGDKSYKWGAALETGLVFYLF